MRITTTEFFPHDPEILLAFIHVNDPDIIQMLMPGIAPRLKGRDRRH